MVLYSMRCDTNIVLNFIDLYGIALYSNTSSTRVRIPAGACKRVASDLRLCGGFCRVLRFPPPLASHDFKNEEKIEIRI